MKQAVSSRQGKNYERVPFSVIKDARGGDIEAMSLIQQHFDPFIRNLATINVRGTNYLNTDLYEHLKTKLIIATMKFKI